MRACDNEVAYEVALACRESDNALASAALCLVGVGRNSLDVTEMCECDRNILFIDQSLFIELALVCNDLGAAWISPLLLDLEQLVLDDSHQQMLVCEQALVVSDLFLQLFILGLDLLAFESLQLGEPHIEYRLCLDLAEPEPDHQLFFGVVVCRADGLDDLVDVVERDDESF